MAEEIDPESFGLVVEFTPADRTAERSVPGDVVAAPALPPEPTADAQEIVLSPPGSGTGAEPLHLFFETDAKDLPKALAETTESLYVLFGHEVLDAFEAALRGTGESAAPGAMLLPTPLQGEPYYRGPIETPKRHKLVTAYPDGVRALGERVSEAIAKTTTAAAAWAIGFLQEQQQQIVDQAFRYLLTDPAEQRGDPGARRAAVAQHLSAIPFGVEISGPDAVGLVTALREVRPSRDAFRTNQREALVRQLERRAILGGLLSVTRGPVPAAVAVATAPVTTPAEDTADVDVRAKVAAEIERIGAAHPVIHRLWTTDAVDLVKRAETIYPRSDDAELALRLSTETAYRRIVGQALYDTLDACTDMLRELDDADHIWDYPVALRRALKEQGVARGSLVFGAVDDRLSRLAGPSTVNRVNELVGHLQLVLLAGGPTAPAAGLLEIVSLGLSVLEAAEAEWKAWHQNRASKTHLNPGLSLAAEPSYVEVLLAILGVGFNAFGLRGAKP